MIILLTLSLEYLVLQSEQDRSFLEKKKLW